MHRWLLIIFCVLWSGVAFSFPSVTIQSVSGTALDGPAHHGLLIQTDGIWDPSLSYYEIQVAPASNNPVIPWMVYNTKIKSVDAAAITIPYRNGIVALQSGVTYCVSIRAVYANQVTPWSQKCGVQLGTGDTVSGDTDGDGVANMQEYALGLDPNNPDTDDDGVSDGVELAQGTDPNKPLVASIEIQTPVLDFGKGTPMGTFSNQHKVLVLANKSAQPAKVLSIALLNGTQNYSSEQFKVGAYPQSISNIPPYNVARIPVSFLPHVRGDIDAKLVVVMANNQTLDAVVLKGTGVSIPNCSVTPATLDFSNMAGQPLAVNTITISDTTTSNLIPPPDRFFGFTILTDDNAIAPGLRGLRLPVGKELKVPILLQKSAATPSSGNVIVRSFHCGDQFIKVVGGTP